MQEENKKQRKYKQFDSKIDRRNKKAPKIDRAVGKAQKKYNRLSKPSLLKRASNKETYIKLTREKRTDKDGNVSYKTKARVALRDKKYQGAGVLHFAVRRIDKLGGDVPSLEKKLHNSVPKTTAEKVARSSLLTGTKVLKKTWKTTLHTGLAAETAMINGTKKAVGAVTAAAESKLKGKANEALEPLKVYLKIGEHLVSPRDLKKYLKQRKIYHIEKSKSKLLKKDFKKAKNDTKIAKYAYKQKKIAYQIQKEKVRSDGETVRLRHELLKAKKDHAAVKRTKRYSPRNEQTKRLLKTNRETVREKKKEYRTYIKNRTARARLDRSEKRAVYRNKLSSSHGVVAGKKREYALQKRTAKYEKPRSLTSEKARLLGSQLLSSITYADDNNTTLVALGKAVQAGSSAASVTANTYKLLNKTSIKAEGKLREAARKTSQNKLRKKTQKLNSQKKQATAVLNNQIISPKKNIREKAAEVVKGFGSAAAGAAGKFIIFCFPLALMLMMIVMVLYCLMNSFTGMVNSAGAWTLGTYQADDFDLSNAETAYTKRADGLNKKIVKLSNALAGDSEKDWKNTLVDVFGADKRKLRKKPIEVYWGRSSRFDWDPVYDFDREKLWSFLCAYYTKIDPATGNASFTNWDYTDSTEALIDKLFKEEYEFEYYYEEEVTKWGELKNDDKVSYGYWDDWIHPKYLGVSFPQRRNNFVPGTYMNMFPCEDTSIEYNVGKDAKWRFKFKILPVNGSYDSEGNDFVGASHLSEYADDENYIYVDKMEISLRGKTNGYRVLNPHNNFAPTEYSLRDTLHIQFDDSSDGFIGFYYAGGPGHPDETGFFTHYGVNTIDNYTVSKHFSTPFLSSLTDNYVNFIIPKADVEKFSDGEYNQAVYAYLEAYYPIEYYSRLYYNVRQKATLDDVIRNILKAQKNGNERIALYEMYLGISEDSPALHGGHQIFHTILPGESFYEDYVATGKIATGFGYDMFKWNNITHINQQGDNDEKHNGIDVYAVKNTRIYAVFSGVIKKVDNEQHSIFLETDSFKYHYEKGADYNVDDITGRATSARYYNVIPVGTLAEGSKVKEGDVIGYTTGDIWCRGKDNSKYVGDPYLHFEVYIDKDGLGWDFVDPIPLLGNKKAYF